MNQKLRLFLFNAILAASYVVLTISLSFISYGAIQFRIAECLMILVLFNYRYIYGLSIGVLVANIASPAALIDMAFGTIATIIALVLVIISKKILPVFLRLIFIVIINALIVGWEISFFFGVSTSFWLNVGYVAIGEVAVVYAIGLPLYYLLKRNRKINQYLTNNSLE
ncbi:MAG: QueT transporter family protein [Acholeplasmatales bacterium]|jgi:uncharacterized membrane protein|nr:QueT transporter family protein [Acholeplasmatales bacterium]